MYPKKDRVISLLENAIDEMDLLGNHGFSCLWDEPSIYH